MVLVVEAADRRRPTLCNFAAAAAASRAPFSSPDAMDHTALETLVSTALERSPYVSRRNLRFETQEGRVTLRGVVPSYFQKQMAQEVLRNLEGVEEIENELEVCWA